jgi:hypothetical protein
MLYHHNKAINAIAIVAASHSAMEGQLNPKMLGPLVSVARPNRLQNIPKTERYPFCHV